MNIIMKKKLTIRLRGKLYRKFHHSRRRRFSCRARLSRSSSVCSELCNRARWTIRHRRTLQFLRWACRPSRWTPEWTTEWLRSWTSCWRSAGRASSVGTAPKAVHCPGWTAYKRCTASPCRRPSWRLSVSAPGWISKRSWISESDRELWFYSPVHYNRHDVEKPNLHQLRVHEAEFCDDFELFYERERNAFKRWEKSHQTFTFGAPQKDHLMSCFMLLQFDRQLPTRLSSHQREKRLNLAHCAVWQAAQECICTITRKVES